MRIGAWEDLYYLTDISTQMCHSHWFKISLHIDRVISLNESMAIILSLQKS
jgi:hypothetical protein